MATTDQPCLICGKDGEERQKVWVQFEEGGYYAYGIHADSECERKFKGAYQPDGMRRWAKK